MDDDALRERLQLELEQDILAPPPPGARAGVCLPALGEWLVRAHGLLFVPDGCGALTAWGTTVTKVALCTVLKVAEEAPQTVPPDLVRWLRTYVLQPSAAEDEIARLAADVLRRVAAAGGAE